MKRSRFIYSLVGIFSLATVALVMATSQLDRIANRYAKNYLPELSAKIGRTVQVQRIDTGLFGGLKAEVHGASVGIDRSMGSESKPIVELARARVALGLWSVVRYFLGWSKSIKIHEIVVDGLQVNAVQYPDGTLNIDHFKAKLDAAFPKSEKPMDAKTRALIKGLRLGHFKVQNTSFSFEEVGHAPVGISNVDIDARDLCATSPFRMAVSAAILAPKPNFKVDATFGKAPEDLESAPPLVRLTMKLTPVDLSPLAGFIARRLPDFEAGTVSADIDANLGAAAEGGNGPTVARGRWELLGLKFKGGVAPVNLRAQVDVSGDAQRGDLDIKTFDISMATMDGSEKPMGIKGHGSLEAMRTQPKFHDFHVATYDANFDKIQRIYPGMSKGMRFSGPFEVRVDAAGDQSEQAFNVVADFSAASIAKSDVFQKPLGVPLKLEAVGSLKDNALTTRTFSLRIANLLLNGSASVRNFAQPVFSATVQGQTLDIGGIARLLPKASLKTSQPVAGALFAKVDARGSASDNTVEAQVRLSKANLKTAEVEIVGDGACLLYNHMLNNNHVRSGDAKIDAELTNLRLKYPGYVDKRPGTPMTLHASWQGTGSGASQSNRMGFETKIASMRAKGQMRTQGQDRPAFEMSMQFTEFDTGEMKSVLPTLMSETFKHTRISGDMQAQGKVGSPERMRVDVRDMQAQAGRSDLRGTLTLQNLLKPKFELRAQSNYLNLEDFFEDDGKKKEKSDRSKLRDVQGTARLEVKRGSAARIDYSDLNCELQMSHGTATAKRLTVRAFDGVFSGSGSEMSLTDENGPFHMVGKIEDLDLGAAVNYLANAGGILKGRFSGQSDVRGVGTTFAAMRDKLNGQLRGELREIEFSGGDLAQSLIKPLSSKLSFVKADAALAATSAKAEKLNAHFKPMMGTIVIKDGAVDLKTPLRYLSSLGPLDLAGRAFLSGKLDMSGNLQINKVQASALVGNTVNLNESLPLKLGIGGTWMKPSVQILDLDRVAKVYAAAYAKSALQSSAGKAVAGTLDSTGLGKTLEKAGPLPTSEAEAKAKADAERARLQAEAERQAQAAKQQAKARAREEAERAKQQAEHARREAERRAKEEASKQLKGLFGK